MEYQGKLYGKVGKQYFPLSNTTEDFKSLEKTNSELLQTNKELFHKHQLEIGELKDILSIIPLGCIDVVNNIKEIIQEKNN